MKLIKKARTQKDQKRNKKLFAAVRNPWNMFMWELHESRICETKLGSRADLPGAKFYDMQKKLICGMDYIQYPAAPFILLLYP